MMNCLVSNRGGMSYLIKGYMGTETAEGRRCRTAQDYIVKTAARRCDTCLYFKLDYITNLREFYVCILGKFEVTTQGICNRWRKRETLGGE
jgi:hypothetical protein